MKYHVVVFGCQMNTSDGERVAAVFKNLKMQKTERPEKADFIAVVMCSVRQSAVDRVHFLAHKFTLSSDRVPRRMTGQNHRPITILTGCVLKKDKKKLAQGFDYIIDIKDIKKLPEILNIKKIKSDNNYLTIKPEYSSKYAANVPIMTGCNNFCTYCVVPYTREREISRPAKEIICEVKNLVKNGYKEIWLLGQNVNSYSNVLKNNGIVSFPKLLKMADAIPGNFELNFTSSHPKDFSDELIDTMAKCKHLSKKLNLPIQSGDDEILKRMNRPYTVEEYKNLVAKIKKAIPDISLSTDVIVGFPGETKKQFENTVKTFKKVGFDLAFINKYSPRAGTAAAKMEDNVPWAEKKRREKILIDLVNAK